MFPHVVIVSFDKIIKGEEGGNVVAVAGDRPMPVDQLQRRVSRYDKTGMLKVMDERTTAEYAGDHKPLTDDFAPVDQLISVPLRYW